MKQKKNISVDMISVECAEGKHRSFSMTECESCSLGTEPNEAKDDCGKKTLICSDNLINRTFESILVFYNKLQYYGCDLVH